LQNTAKALDGARDFSGAQALRTNVYTLDRAILADPNRLDIRVPLTPRMAVRVGNIIAGHLPLAADLTLS
jgi:hypothetical protein